MAPFQGRKSGAGRAARGTPIRPSDFEVRVGAHYTAETLEKLQRRYPNHNFIWLMGADGLGEIFTCGATGGGSRAGSRSR